MRSYADVATSAVREMLGQLIDSRSTEDYRALMTRLGEELGTMAGHKLKASDRIMLVCTNEDADFLAKGVLHGLEQMGCTHITLACFWNARQRTQLLDVAPIVRQYIEPVHKDSINVFVVIKSIISSACVIRTNISELVYDFEPERVLILAPVVLVGAQQNLEAEFDPEIAARFEYLWFAQDDQKEDDGTVVPGIGGSVYELLGIGTSETKNSFVPQLVESRREAIRLENV